MFLPRVFISQVTNGNQGMLRPWFPMATGTHGKDNSCVEEQEVSGHSDRIGGFQQGRTSPLKHMRCFWFSSTHTNVHRNTNRCKSASPVLRHNGYCPQGVYTLVSLDIKMKRTNRGQETSCNDVCVRVCVHVNTWLVTICCVWSVGLITTQRLTAEPTKGPTCPSGVSWSRGNTWRGRIESVKNDLTRQIRSLRASNEVVLIHFW